MGGFSTGEGRQLSLDCTDEQSNVKTSNRAFSALLGARDVSLASNVAQKSV